MRARAAAGDGAVVQATADYAAALAADPANTIVARHAYRQAIEVGDMALADRAATALGAGAPADAALLALAAAAAAKDMNAADAAIARIAQGPLALLAAPLRAWVAFDRGQDPLVPLAARPKDAVARRFVEETRGLIMIAQGRVDAGRTALAPVLGEGQAAQDLRIAAAQLLIGAGQHVDARALLIGPELPLAAPALTALRKNPGAGVKPSLAFGASRLFARIASDIAAGPPGALSILLTRAALRADPRHDRARILLASALARSSLPDSALAVLAPVDPDGPYAAAALAARIETLRGADRLREALAVAERRATPADAPAAALQRYADLLVEADRAQDAAAIYARLLDRPDHAADWATWLQYGGALDTAGDWARARPAIERAVALAPDEPAALNYLGYAQLEHGDDPVVARALLEKASRLAPTDAAITDSLGWAYHRSGQNQRAVPLLERAAAAAPDNAEIGEHLGDAYWAAGRRYEARYAWRAATLTADTADTKRLTGKIATGPAAQ